MSLPRRSLLDPLLQYRDVTRRQLLARIDRRHELLGIGGDDALDEFARIDFPRHDRLRFRVRSKQTGLRIEPQFGLSLVRIRAMTDETVLGKYRPHVAIELDHLRQRRLSRPGDSSSSTYEANADQQAAHQQTAHELTHHLRTPSAKSKPPRVARHPAGKSRRHDGQRRCDSPAEERLFPVRNWFETTPRFPPSPRRGGSGRGEDGQVDVPLVPPP